MLTVISWILIVDLFCFLLLICDIIYFKMKKVAKSKEECDMKIAYAEERIKSITSKKGFNISVLSDWLDYKEYWTQEREKFIKDGEQK